VLIGGPKRTKHQPRVGLDWDDSGNHPECHFADARDVPPGHEDDPEDCKHCRIKEEVYEEFRRLQGNAWDSMSRTLYQYMEENKRRWAEHGQWWRKTVVGKKYESDYAAKRNKAHQDSFACFCVCQACGKKFSVSRYKVRRGHTRTCSVECRGSSRKNIKIYDVCGERGTLSALAERHGIKMATAWARINRGWTVERALGIC